MSLQPQHEAELTAIIQGVNPEVFVVEMALHRSKMSSLVILIDTDAGIKLDECTKISRAIGHHLEEHPDFEFRYTLEVSSPGVGRPLKLLRQYHQNVGRDLRVRGLEGEEWKGTLLEVKEDAIVLKPEKKKRKAGGTFARDH